MCSFIALNHSLLYTWLNQCSLFSPHFFFLVRKSEPMFHHVMPCLYAWWFWPRPHETLCCNKQRKVTWSFSKKKKKRRMRNKVVMLMLMVLVIGHHGVDIGGDSDVDCDGYNMTLWDITKRVCPLFVISSTSEEVVFRNLKLSIITISLMIYEMSQGREWRRKWGGWYRSKQIWQF